jgi:hypothetical protein
MWHPMGSLPPTVRSKFLPNLSTFAFWAGPPLLLLVLYWPGLMAWFQKDDFAWLGLRDLVHSWRDFWWALFAPLAQGTIRTLSERIYFMSFSTLFGLHALPYRIWVFLTGFAAITMLSVVSTRLTRSRAAGFWAAVLWTVNNSTAFVFSWTAIYYELLCALFFLVAIWLLIRYAESGERRFYVAQWIIYLLAFGVLELNVVYPALALAYAICCARHIIRKTIPLFIPAAAYTWLHLATAPLMTRGPYRMFWDASVFSTFWSYWKCALGPNRLIYAGIYPSVYRSSLAIILMVALFGFLGWTVYKRQWLTLFFAAWFVIVLAPLLPLRDHFTDCYLTIPMIGLAMWGSWGFVCGWRAGVIARVAATLVMIIYLGVNLPIARINCVSFFENSRNIRRLVYGVADATANQPEKLIVLKGVSKELFWDAVWNRPFRLVGRNQIFLISEDGPDITAALEPDLVPQFFMTAKSVNEAVDQDRAVVLDVAGGDIRDVTPEYLQRGAPR